MKIKCCGYKTVVVEMTHDEFFGITGNAIGDSYGNNGYSWAEAEGKEFSLEKERTHQKNVQNILALKSNYKRTLKEIETSIDALCFPIQPVSFVDGSKI